MKNVTYRKKDFSNRKGRVLCVRENSRDKECDSRVRKNFVYFVSSADQMPQEAQTPEIHMVKRIDTGARQELFIFKVKGAIFIRKQRFIYRIDYSHSLMIRMHWRTHVLSSDPATLA